MAQADNRPTTTRRVLLAGAASLPALAVPANAATSNAEDPELLALCEQAHKAWDRISAACDLLAPAERAVIGWRRRNPEPEWDQAKGRSVGSTLQVLSAVEREVLRTSDPVAYEKIMQMQGDLLLEEYGARKRAWRARKEVAARNARVPEAEAAQDRANDAYSDLVDQIAEIPATTIAGLKAKVQLSNRTERGSADNYVAVSLIEDIATGRVQL